MGRCAGLHFGWPSPACVFVPQELRASLGGLGFSFSGSLSFDKPVLSVLCMWRFSLRFWWSLSTFFLHCLSICSFYFVWVPAHPTDHAGRLLAIHLCQEEVNISKSYSEESHTGRLVGPGSSWSLDKQWCHPWDDTDGKAETWGRSKRLQGWPGQYLAKAGFEDSSEPSQSYAKKHSGIVSWLQFYWNNLYCLVFKITRGTRQSC